MVYNNKLKFKNYYKLNGSITIKKVTMKIYKRKFSVSSIMFIKTLNEEFRSTQFKVDQLEKLLKEMPEGEAESREADAKSRIKLVRDEAEYKLNVVNEAIVGLTDKRDAESTNVSIIRRAMTKAFRSVEPMNRSEVNVKVDYFSSLSTAPTSSIALTPSESTPSESSTALKWDGRMPSSIIKSMWKVGVKEKQRSSLSTSSNKEDNRSPVDFVVDKQASEPMIFTEPDD